MDVRRVDRCILGFGGVRVGGLGLAGQAWRGQWVCLRAVRFSLSSFFRSFSHGGERMAFTQRLVLLGVERLAFQVDLAELERERENENE